MAFPCNDFGKQEPAPNSEIISFAAKQGATFQIYGKLRCEANEETHPLFVYLKDSLDNGIYGQSLKWNFTKFLVNHNGIPVKRYAPTDGPLSFEDDIVKLFEEAESGNNGPSTVNHTAPTPAENASCNVQGGCGK